MFENHSQDTRYTGPLEVAQTVSATYGTGGNNQPFVVESAGFCTEHSAQARGIGYEEEKSPTIVASGAGGIAHPKYSTSKNSHHTVAEKEKANTLVASDYKDPPVVNDSTPEIEYIVRRLTPQECARLQGFPDQWCSDLASENPTEEEIDRWAAIFEEYRKAVKPESRPKSRKMVQKWLQDPYRDAAEYRLWGNGICLNVAVFVLAGIVWADL